MEVGLFLFGLLLGVLLGWRWLGERRSIVPPAHDLEAIRARAGRAEARVRDLEAAREAAEARVAAVGQARLRQAEEEEAGRVRPGAPAVGAPVGGRTTVAASVAGPAAAPAAKPGAAEGADDLTRIKGIGPKLAVKLRSMGYTSFRQLAELTPDEMRRIDKEIEFAGRVERDRWAEQARMLMSG